MLRYLPGIILIQLVTLALLWVNRDGTATELMTRAALPALLLSLVTALWFSALSKMQSQRTHAQLVEKHFQEREMLNRELERSRLDVLQKASADQARILERATHERERIVKQTHRDMLKAERRASRRANTLVGAAFTLVTLAGVGLLLIQFMTVGVLTITAASGALGGYVLRWRQTRHVIQTAAKDARLVTQLPEPMRKELAAEHSKPIIIDAKLVEGGGPATATASRD